MYLILDPSHADGLIISFVVDSGRRFKRVALRRNYRASSLTAELIKAAARARVHLKSLRGVAVVEGAVGFTAARLVVVVSNMLSLLYGVPVRYIKPGCEGDVSKREGWSRNFLITHYSCAPNITLAKNVGR